VPAEGSKAGRRATGRSGAGSPARRGAASAGRGASGQRRDAGPERRTGSSQRRDAGPERRSGSPERPADRRGTRPPRPDEPPLPAAVDTSVLDAAVRAELRPLSKAAADAVAGHLVMTAEFLDTDPRRALAHARAARARAGRIAAVREAVGIAAYHAEEWSEALTELRTARRISGDARNLPVIADCERALGRPAQALRALDDPSAATLDPPTRAELLIVVAGARRDLGQLDAALSVLARGGIDPQRPKPGSMRLWYAYADALEAAGRRAEAARWFAASAALDPEGELDAAERAAALS
jgi:tetratricopeptide (TPR) repeat protein